jgi:hypothetical protein
MRKQTQFPPGVGGPTSHGRGPIRQNEPSLGIESCQTNPIWPGWAVNAQTKLNLGELGHLGKGRRVGRGAAGSQTCETNPISASNGRSRAGTPNPRRGEACETNPIWPGRGRLTGGDCAKRSQTWGDWGMWAKPGSEMCETNPISKCQVSSLKFQGAGRKEHVPGPLTSNFKPQTSNSLACKTKPMTGGFLVAAGT